MARRRIELPSADVLFGDGPVGAKPAARPKKSAAKKPAAKATAAKPKTRAAKASPPKTRAAAHAPKKPAKAPTRKPAAKRTPRTARPKPEGFAEARLAAVESRLADLPVDTLIDLRDGLEELLSADVVDVDAVERLLDSVGA